MENRLKWLDTAKGIAIILVVIAHSLVDLGFSNKYIYWFHMPAFFIITGILFSPPTNREIFKTFFIKRVKQLIIPYISFLLIITLVRYVYLGVKPLTWYINDFAHVIAGGQSIPSAAYVTMWFITCLLASQLLISIIYVFIANNIYRFFIILTLYILAHVESVLSLKYEIHIPGNLDVSFLAISYIYIGMSVRYLQEFLNKKNLCGLFTVSLFISSLFLIFSNKNIINYQLDMYKKAYYSLPLDIIIPLSFTISLLGISFFLSKINLINNLLDRIGSASLIIMYLHIPIKLIIEIFLGKEFFVEVTLIILGIIIPLIITIILNQFQFTSMLLLGKSMSKGPLPNDVDGTSSMLT